MWLNSFESRLQSWSKLRQTVVGLPAESCLITINKWWFDAPWCPYSLHWDDQHIWPDPWQLLDDNAYCSLARALGIMYTICLLDRKDFESAELVDTGNDNLVLVHQEKYILNWHKDSVVNIVLPRLQPKRRLSLAQIQKLIK